MNVFWKSPPSIKQVARKRLATLIMCHFATSCIDLASEKRAGYFGTETHECILEVTPEY